MKKPRHDILKENLPQLQNLIKRDPASYKEEFLQQWNHFISMFSIFQLKPQEEDDRFCSIVNFISQVISCFPEEKLGFTGMMIELLQKHLMVLHSSTRKTMIQALITLRLKSMIDQVELLSFFFTMFRCPDQVVRGTVYNFVIQEIKNANQKHKSNKLNKILQNLMYAMLKDVNGIAAKKSLDVLIELYRKNVWNDAKTVNIIAEACFSSNVKLSVAALHFFLGLDAEEEEEEGQELPDIRGLQHQALVAGKSKARMAKMKKAISTIKKKEKSKNKVEHFNFSAVHLLNDPQGFAEKLFSVLKATNVKFEIRLMMINVCSRVIGIHKLLVLPFYSYLIKYMEPHQLQVTSILAYASQASHDLVPPEDIEPLVKAIADRFVSDRCTPEAITVGINSIREICARCPLSMNQTLLSDLAQYKSFKGKGVMMAAKSLIQLFREKNPEILHRKDRGRATGKIGEKISYGHVEAVSDIYGADVLDLEEGEWVEEQKNASDGEEWINVDDEGDFINIEDDGEDWVEEEIEGSGDGECEESDDEEDDEEIEEDEEIEVGNENEIQPKPKSIIESRILTPSDFAKIQSAKLSREADSLLGSRKRKSVENDSEIVDVSAIEASLKKQKHSYEERMASIKSGREGREKYGSKKGKQEKQCSSTNKEKSKKKNFVMMIHKKGIKLKAKKSLKEKRNALKAHAKRQKMKKK